MASKSEPFFQIRNKNCIEGHIFDIFCSDVLWIEPEEIITYPIKFHFEYSSDFDGIIFPTREHITCLEIKPRYFDPTNNYEVMLSIENTGEFGLRIEIGEKLGVLIIMHNV